MVKECLVSKIWGSKDLDDFFMYGSLYPCRIYFLKQYLKLFFISSIFPLINSDLKQKNADELRMFDVRTTVRTCFSCSLTCNLILQSYRMGMMDPVN